MSSAKLVLDLGTSSVKAFLFDEKNTLVRKASRPLQKCVDGLCVEQDPYELRDDSIAVLCEVAGEGVLHEIGSVGITTQRESFLFWDEHGTPITPVIVWQDERTRGAEGCTDVECEIVKKKTGLSVVPYFSATKMRWALDTLIEYRSGVRWGTLDTWLLYSLTGEYRTDHTNASRTLLFNIHTRQWDDELLGIFDIPRDLLPEALPSQSAFGVLRREVFGKEVPVQAIVGDQEASLFAAGEDVGTTKVTFGSGVFVMQVVPEDTEQGSFFKTVTASKREKYCLEYKVRRLAEYITPVLDDKSAVHALIDETVEAVAPIIRQLPITPQRIVIDGGVTQDPYLAKALEDKVDVPVVPQDIYDGTALGVARLLR